MSDFEKNELITQLMGLFEKYKEEEYMMQRLHSYLFLHLPSSLENEYLHYKKKQNLNTFLSEEQKIFIQVFLSKNNYFYLSNSGFFYEYNQIDYLIVKEDEIIYKLLSAISKDRVLMQWKHKTKTNIIKQIKDKNLFNSTPETNTIQNVLSHLFPSFFPTKNSAKYFLTALGDNLLKKNDGNIFIISSMTKNLLADLEQIVLSSVGISNIFSNFISKYHKSHNYSNCRLLKMNDNISTEHWRETLNKIGLNLICVSSYYSNRYNNSDSYLLNKADEELMNFAYTIKNTTPNELIDKFIDECIEETSPDYLIEWKNLHFIWKQYLSKHNLPNIISQLTLKNALKNIIKYDETTDKFKGITSKYLPAYKDFIEFWETTTTRLTGIYDFSYVLEIDEICTLYKLWTKNNNKCSLSEENIMKVLKHFFQIELINDKYVYNISSNMWNKFDDTTKCFKLISQSLTNSNLNSNIISFDEIYEQYVKFKHLQKDEILKLIVSKQFFENYLSYVFSGEIVYDKFITIEKLISFSNL